MCCYKSEIAPVPLRPVLALADGRPIQELPEADWKAPMRSPVDTFAYHSSCKHVFIPFMVFCSASAPQCSRGDPMDLVALQEGKRSLAHADHRLVVKHTTIPRMRASPWPSRFMLYIMMIHCVRCPAGPDSCLAGPAGPEPWAPSACHPAQVAIEALFSPRACKY